ncbi:MAG: alanine racemase [Verrucomicrobiae bacterium]|nr:alanine racemase [Verrucomicrobiae bacterium]
MNATAQNLRAWAEIDFEALRSNVHFVRTRVGAGVRIMASVKADAYGHGLPQIAATLMQAGVDMFGVANLAEALTIRHVGEGWHVLLLGAALPGERSEIVAHGLCPSLSSIEEALAFNSEAGRQKVRLPVHAVVDTGMGRLGFWHEDAAAALVEISRMPHLEWRGLYTHFASADDDADFTALQWERFQGLITCLGQQGLRPPLLHASNSAGLLRESRYHLDMVRPGVMIYGSSPLPEYQDCLIAPLSLKSRITFLKEVGPGRTLSYGHTFTAPHKMRVATVSIGYGDGFPRHLSGRAQVLVGGMRCPLLGRVTMDQILVDVSAIPAATPGDEVVLIGTQGGERITADELAGLAGTISYEIFTGITKRVPRLYRGATAA